MANDPPFSGPGNDLVIPITPSDYVTDIEDNFTKCKDEIIGVDTRLKAATGPSAASFIEVQDEGLVVPQSPFKKLNFLGAAVTAVDFDDEQVDITISSAPRELWFPAVFGGNGNFFGDYQVALNTAAIRYFTFFIPTDFMGLTSCVLVYIKRDTDNQQWQLESDYGAAGEQYNNHSESQLTGLVAETDGRIYELDITGVLSSIAAGDYVGVSADPINRARVLGIRMIYTIA